MDADEVDEEEKVETIPAPATPDYGDDDCDHGFLVHDPDDHGNVYHCKVCDERFAHHPGDEPEKKVDVVRVAKSITESMGKFHGGLMTLTNALEETGLAIDEFTKVWKKNFPPDTETVQCTYDGSPITVEPEVISSKPPRETCPQVIEKLFENPDVTVNDLRMILNSAFPDVVTVNHTAMEWMKAVRIEIEFCDGSTQLVIMEDNMDRKRGWSK